MALSGLMTPNMARGAVPTAVPGPAAALPGHRPSAGGQGQDHLAAKQADDRAKGTQRRTPGEGSLRQCQVKGCTKRGKTSQFRGVSWSKPKHRWQACIRVARRQFFLGRYQDEREAAQAYDRAALRHYPADAVRTNFPGEVYLSDLESIREG